MEVGAEAKRIMVVALGKLYGSRSQRGGLRLHRSLLLTLVMKSARDMYHEAHAAAAAAEEEESAAPGRAEPPEEMGAEPAAAPEEPRTAEEPRANVAAPPTQARTGADNKENVCRTQPPRKRRGKAAAEPDFLPCKKAKLEQAGFAQPLNPVLMDFANCGSELAASPTPILLQRAVAVC